MRNIQFLNQQIAHAQAQKNTASEQGDYRAFQWWEREESNYTMMKNDYLSKTGLCDVSSTKNEQ